MKKTKWVLALAALTLIASKINMNSKRRNAPSSDDSGLTEGERLHPNHASLMEWVPDLIEIGIKDEVLQEVITHPDNSNSTLYELSCNQSDAVQIISYLRTKGIDEEAISQLLIYATWYFIAEFSVRKEAIDFAIDDLGTEEAAEIINGDFSALLMYL